ncbi:MAG: glycine--tRNA ligase subunit beta [Alphaproteobacteria bacterium]|nr:glycine--tRNA ligase subunit beta [Alphaproteobacteria bacterium]
MPELLLELLSEEVPARMQGRAAEDLARLAAEALAAAGLTAERIETLCTPRRLTLVATGLPAAQPDIREEKRGPRRDAPDNAIKGFLQSVGRTRDQVEERETGKGVFLFAVLSRQGRPTAEVLAELLPTLIGKVPWPRSMRWGNHEVRWVRPLQSILCLFAGAVVPFSFGPIPSGSLTRGHRWHAPDLFPVADFADYQQKLRDARVMLNAGERRDYIEAQARFAATQQGAVLVDDPGLLDEVAGLVEWPVALRGAIDARFMDLPPEVLRVAMRNHQRYFAVQERGGQLAPWFVFVANLEAKDRGRAIVAGNERVLRARLADAKFFWDLDRKQSLASRVPRLKEIVFHARLGTLDARVDRIEALAADLCRFVPGADKDQVQVAARLAKADLVTGMVGEFPELQGIMGRYYALADGELPAVASAIADHYAPKGPDDRCPTGPVAVAVALADKIDTLVGFFAADEKPTGSKDPFSLRRAALGVIRLVLENKLRLPLRQAFGAAHAGYARSEGFAAADAVAGELMTFCADRLKVHLRGRGIGHDLIAAVFALTADDDLVRLIARVDALLSFLAGDDGANLLVAYRRATNIVRIESKKDERGYDDAPDPSLFDQPEEQALHSALVAVKKTAAKALGDERFGAAMVDLARLRGPTDAFFERVTVNADRPELRVNRLRLLSQIRSALDGIADFSQLEG